MRFSDIPGQEEAKRRLRELAEGGRIPHAILLEGPEGTGKHALARAFLQYVGCHDRRDGDSCGRCASCRQHSALQHIDTVYSFPYVKRKSGGITLSSEYLKEFIEFVHESPFMDSALWLEKLGKPNTRPSMFVEEANELIRRLSFSSHSSPYNSVVIWQVDRLNEPASNKLLKVLEEPPGASIIVMTTDEPMNLLPTIYSRAQRIKVKRLSDEEIADWMVSVSDIDDNTVRQIAPLAEGSLLAAQRLLSSRHDTDRFLEFFKSLMRLAYRRDIAGLKEWSLTVATEKRDTIVEFLEYVARMVRENFVANLHRDNLNLMTAAEKEFSVNFARFINEKNVQYIFDGISEAINDIRGNVSPKIVLFDFAITVILRLKQN